MLRGKSHLAQLPEFYATMFKIPALFDQQIHLRFAAVLSRLLLSLFLFMLSAPLTAQPETADSTPTTAESTPDTAQPDTGAASQESAQKLDNPEAIWLGESDAQFIGFFRPAIKPAGIGVAILANSNYPSLNDDLFMLSYQMLADYGWSTLRMMLPEIQTQTQAKAIPENSAPTTKPAVDSEDANLAQESGTTEPQKEIDLRVNLSVKHLLANDNRFAVLLTGTNFAAQAFSHAQKNNRTVRGIALWQVNSAALNQEALKSLSATNFQIIDIVADTHDAAWINERKRAFALAGFSDNYLLIQSPTHGIGTLHASRRIRYWLETRF